MLKVQEACRRRHYHRRRVRLLQVLKLLPHLVQCHHNRKHLIPQLLGPLPVLRLRMYLLRRMSMYPGKPFTIQTILLLLHQEPLIPCLVQLSGPNGNGNSKQLFKKLLATFFLLAKRTVKWRLL
jgi:hypothetical protein